MTDKLKVVAYLNHRACMPPFLDFFASAGTIRAEPLVLQSEAQAALDAALERVKVLEAERDEAKRLLTISCNDGALRALRADAAKFRWMADRFLGADFDWNESDKSVLLIEFPHEEKVWGDLDMTVEAAMEVKHG